MLVFWKFVVFLFSDKIQDDMITTKKQEINWLFPNENQTVTTDDFRAMVCEAERQKGMSLSEYKSKMDSWWQNHL
ncbi:hypothetical protein FACS1894162_6320 [Bacteroidia bacterium]|nr:hypothetical protein FACS1894162_6320 [Bacteroidia bacterium]